MNQINSTLKALEKNNGKAFVPYITAGVNGLEKFKEQLLFLQNENVTMIEVGIPFSDPTADGPVIQVASQKALENGITLEIVLNFLQEIKNELHVPIVIMSYFNPVYKYGIKRFIAHLKCANISACIIPDLPLEEEAMIVPLLKTAEIHFIRLVTVTNNNARLKKIISKSSGFLYAVTVTGTTGTNSQFHKNLIPFLQKVKKISKVPILAGFGINTREDIKVINEYCDGVIVGSKIIELLEKHEYKKISQLINI